jgi:hypothetical protein
MDATASHNDGEDFGTLVISFSDDDDAVMQWENGRASVRVPVYSYQAREIIAALSPIAAEDDA